MPLELHVLARLGTICCTGGFLALIILVGNWHLSSTRGDKVPLELHVLARLGTICCTGGFLALISVRFRKNVVARFSPGFGRSPNPGQASDSKPRGGSVKASMGV